MKIAAAELRKRIEQGEDLEAISLSLIAPAEQGLLRCCAVVRTFDEKLVDDYFRPQVPGADKETVPFSALTGRDFVQRVPRTDGVYSLQPATQKKYYESWWESSDVPRSEVPTALRELSVSLLEHYAALGDEGKLDLLTQQVFVDKEKACDLFEELYKAADAVFDLAHCNDIINVLTGFENVLGPVLATRLNDTRRYLGSRRLWATEYYQTVSYYDRKELNSGLEAFLAGIDDGEKKWILHLHAPGGMGKTMFVRWLIARRCVPRPDTIPCGRVDFDFVNRITATQHRWRLFLQIADALERQIPGNFFHSLIGKFTDYERILNHQQSQQATSSTTTQLPPREKLEEEMLYLFGNALRDAELNEPVVLIFDTLEEVILYHPENLLEIVRQVNTLRKAFPNVLLVLSGRYDLTESGPDAATRLPQFNKEFGAVTHTLRVEPFTDEEALGFLQLRGLTEDRPLEIVVEKAEGNPFKLALFADILLDDPKITADTIRGYPNDVDLLYLIERVLARIPNKTLHWLLRYGVVPRKLTLSFVKDVMQKHLLRAISGDDPLDDPSRYSCLTPKVHATVREKEIFVKTSAQDLDLDQLWKDLQNYASKFAWVTMDAADPNIASFHGDVVNPMRRWLEEEPVYKLLHQDAIAYFEQKAQAEPKNWGKWMSNAVYHKFQLEGEEAAGYWRQLVVNEADPARRHEVASEIIGSEYVDHELKPRHLLNGQQMISTATLVEAYYELARASVEMARAQHAPAGDQLWSDADSDLQTCERLQRELPAPSVPPVSVASLRSSILITQGKVAEAIPILEEALKQNPEGYSRVSLELDLAQAFSLQGDYQKAAFYAESSADGLERFDVTGVLAVAVRRNLARLHRDQGDLEASAAQLRKALDTFPQHESTRSELTNELRDVYFEMGQFSRAKETLATGNPLINDAQSLINQLRELNDWVRYYLAIGDPQRVLYITNDIDGLIRSDFYNVATDKVRKALDILAAQAMEQRGMLMSALFEIEAARQDFESARTRWHELGDSKAVRRCMLKKAELFLDAGEINEAHSILDEATRLSISPKDRFPDTLLNLGIMHFTAKTQYTWKMVADELTNYVVNEDVRLELRVKALLRIGAWKQLPNNEKETTKFFSELTGLLKQIRPVSARMLLLDPLSEYPSCKSIDYHIAQELLDLFPLYRTDDDFEVYAPKLAELLRVLGRRDQAISLLMDLMNKDGGTNSFALRRLFLTFGRTAPRRGKAADLERFLKSFLHDYESHPVLCAATLIELAELSFATHHSSDRLRLLDQADELLKRERSESQWKARLLALRGRLIIKEHLDEALDALAWAMAIYARLGNNLAAEKLQRFAVREDRERSRRSGDVVTKSPVVSPPAKQESEPAQPTATIHIEGNWTDTVTINTTLPGEEITTRHLPIEPASLLDQILAFDTYENYSFSFLRSMDDNWIAACYGLGQILMDDNQGQKLRALAQKSGLRLIIDALQLSSVPWEMMVMPPQSDTPASTAPAFRFFYRSVGKPQLRNVIDAAWLESALLQLGNTAIWAEGVYDKLTEESVKSFQRENRLQDHGRFDGLTRRTMKRTLHQYNGRERPRVFLLRPGVERQRATSRGDEVLGFSLEDYYSRAGFRDLKVVEDPHVASVQEMLSTFEPDVVHICPTMEESTSIGIFLDFGSGGTGVMPKRSVKSASPRQRADTSSGEVQFLTLSALAELMKGHQKPDRARPLLILDVLEPAGRTELLTQLFLRNAFAAQLYETGAFESIIATGLTPPELREQMLTKLISAIGEFESVGDTVNRLRRLTDLGSYTRLPPVGNNLGPLRDSSDNNYLSKVVATAGTALFTPDPEM